MRTLTLSASANVTLDGSGDGTAYIGPTLPGQVYVLTLQVASGGAVSTVSAARIFAVVI